MIHTEFYQQNQGVMGANGNPNTGDLHYAVGLDPLSECLFVVSAWQPTEEEREMIAAGGKVFVGVMCRPNRITQPPICVIGENPFEKKDDAFKKVELISPFQ